jgi:hypothetical protein
VELRRILISPKEKVVEKWICVLNEEFHFIRHADSRIRENRTNVTYSTLKRNLNACILIENRKEIDCRAQGKRKTNYNKVCPRTRPF